MTNTTSSVARAIKRMAATPSLSLTAFGAGSRHAGRAPQGRAAKAVLAVVATGAVVLTAGCTINNGPDPKIDPNAVTESNKDESKTIDLSSNVKDGATEVSVSTPVKVSASKKLESVSLINDAGLEVDGKFNADRSEWSTAEELGYGRTYTLSAKVGEKKLKQTFTTVSPNAITSTALAPLDGATVGTGQVISLFFDTPISDRKAVEEAISVETTPKVEGAFYWLNSQTLRWRPKEFWAPGTSVHVKTELYGKDLGDGTYAEEDREATFTIGDQMKAVVDNNTKLMTFYKNGAAIKEMPVSLGRDTARWATPNGTYVVGDQFDRIKMDSNTFGLTVEKGGYVTDVNWATQLSYSGIFIHGAPWSVWAQGNTNTSHGCINVSDANAQWVYNNLKRGDVVEIKNTTGGQLSGTDGLGDWNIDWGTWSQGNADS